MVSASARQSLLCGLGAIFTGLVILTIGLVLTFVVFPKKIDSRVHRALDLQDKGSDAWDNFVSFLGQNLIVDSFNSKKISADGIFFSLNI